MIRRCVATIVAVGIVLSAGCKRSAESNTENPPAKASNQEEAHHANNAQSDGHAHDEVDLGTVTIGGMKVSFAQGHGKLQAGKEGHLVVKLPYSDKGATVVRAWIGSPDRTLSFVGKGEYAASHDDYDIHAIAPDSLPKNVRWWIEIEKPDGTKVVGSASPLLD